MHPFRWGQCHPRDPFRFGEVENVHANAEEALQGHEKQDIFSCKDLRMEGLKKRAKILETC